MHETSKALRRRMRDPNFATTYFRGRAIDIGAGPDGLRRQLGIWPLLKSVDEWDKDDGDAQELPGVADNTYDLVYSSHCLEHVRDPQAALARWYEVLKPGGHIVVAVPDFYTYERRQWPSRFNPDHKTRFTFETVSNTIGVALAATDSETIKVERITEHFDPSLPPDVDQTMGLAEACIEFIVHKPA